MMSVECPNCKQPYDPASAPRLCPNCGAELPAAPLPELQGTPKTPLTGREWGLLLLGVLAGLASPLLFGVGYLAAVVAYFILYSSRTPFVRGLGFGLLFWGVLFLGAFALCMVGLMADFRK